MSKFIKKVIATIELMKSRYGVQEFSIDMNHDHPVGRCVMDDGNIVMVSGLPNTTGTEAKHVGQNVLKVARQANALGRKFAAYGGGKH